MSRYLDLGFTPHSDHFPTKEQLDEPAIYYPLVVVLCETCGLNQLSFTVDPKVLYQIDYLYESSTTATGVKHYTDLAKSTVSKLGLAKESLVIDIGSNVGVLLSGYKEEGMRILGVDPAPNIAKIAESRGIPTFVDFFIPEAAEKIVSENGKAKLITATNVFAHVFDHHQFMEALKISLDEDGVFIFESPHFSNLVKNLEYDTIYHQHLLYMSLKPAAFLFEKNGMEVFDVETNQIHGGSFRVFVGKKGTHKVQNSVSEMLASEENDGIYNLEKLKAFAKKVSDHRMALMKLINGILAEGKTIAIVSTPAKGMTLLNYCRIGPEHVLFATEKSKLKIGRYTPGTNIPILPDSELISRRPDYALLLAWNFASEIMNNLKEYKDLGGKFIVPVPEPKIY